MNPPARPFADNPFFLSSILAVCTSLGLGALVWTRSENRPLGRVWLAFSCSVAAWGIAGLFFSTTSDYSSAFWAWRLAYVFGVPWIAPTFYHFISIFLNQRSSSIRVHYAIAALSVAGLLTHSFVRDMRWMPGAFFVPVIGPLYIPFIIWWSGLILYAHLYLFRQFRSISEKKRSQTLYFTAATMIGFGGGFLCFLPDFGIDMYPWGNFAISLYPIIMSYAILRHQLLDVRIIIRRTLIYSAVTAAMSAIYLCLFVVGSHVVEQGFQSRNVIYSAAAAALVAVLFHPVQVRIQRWVDRRFPEESVDPVVLRRAAGSLAHEVKRPLANISLPAQLALQDLARVEVESPESERIVASVIQRLQAIVEEVQSTGTKVEAVRELLSLQGGLETDVDLAELLERCVQAHEAQAAQFGQRIVFRSESSMLKIKGNVAQLEVVFGNLIKNAIEAIEEGGKKGTIDVVVRRAGAQHEVEVSDDGIGIDQESLSHIFEPWFTTKGARGMGIGLYLVHEIVKRHKGVVSVKSQVGQGTSFVIRLPRLGSSQ